MRGGVGGGGEQGVEGGRQGGAETHCAWNDLGILPSFDCNASRPYYYGRPQQCSAPRPRQVPGLTCSDKDADGRRPEGNKTRKNLWKRHRVVPLPPWCLCARTHYTASEKDGGRGVGGAAFGEPSSHRAPNLSVAMSTRWNGDTDGWAAAE